MGHFIKNQMKHATTAQRLSFLLKHLKDRLAFGINAHYLECFSLQLTVVETRTRDQCNKADLL